MRPLRIRVLAGVAVAVLAMDIVSRLLVVAELSDRPPVRLPGGFPSLADSSIVRGGVLAVLLSMRGIRLDGLRDDPAAGPAPGEARRASSARPPGGAR